MSESRESRKERKHKKHKHKHKHKKPNRRHLTLTLTSGSKLRAEQMQEEKKEELEELRENLQKAVDFGRKLLGKNHKLKSKYETLKEKARERLKEKVKDFDALSEVNEELEQTVRDMKSGQYIRQVEEEELQEKLEKFEDMETENRRLAHRCGMLKSYLKETRGKYERAKEDKKDMEKRIEMLEAVLSEKGENKKENDKLMDQFNALRKGTSEIIDKQKMDIEKYREIIEKLKAMNNRRQKDYAFKVGIIQNNLGVSLNTVRVELAGTKEDLLTKVTTYMDETNDDFSTLLMKISQVGQEYENRERELQAQMEQQAEDFRERERQLMAERSQMVNTSSNEPPKRELPKIDEEPLLQWVNSYLHAVYCAKFDTTIESFDYETFGDGYLFCALASVFSNSKWLNLSGVFREDSESESNCNNAFEIFESKLGVKSIFSGGDICEEEELVVHYINSLYKKMKKFYEKMKRLFLNKCGEIGRFLTKTLSVKKCRSWRELGKIINQRKNYISLLGGLQVLLKNLCSFYAGQKSTLTEFFREQEFGTKFFAVNKKVLDFRKKLSGSKKGKETSTVISKFNSLSSGYMKWSKKMMKEFLEQGSDERFNENTIYADHDDSEETLFEKNNVLKKNGNTVKKIWKCYHMIDFKKIKNAEDVYFERDEIELENDVLMYALKGVTTKKIKSVEKFAVS